MIGKVAKCRHGIVGVIDKAVVQPDGRTLWKGKSLEGRPWQSVVPVVLADTLEEYNARPKVEDKQEVVTNT